LIFWLFYLAFLFPLSFNLSYNKNNIPAKIIIRISFGKKV
jgi:hypothetical protein